MMYDFNLIKLSYYCIIVNPWHVANLRQKRESRDNYVDEIARSPICTCGSAKYRLTMMQK